MSNTDEMKNFEHIPDAEVDENGLIELAVLPLCSSVIYPKIITLVDIEHEQTLAAARQAQSKAQTVIGLVLRDDQVKEITPEDLYDVGTEMALGYLTAIHDEYKSVMVEGRRRLEIVEIIQTTPYITAKARALEDSAEDSDKIKALEQALASLFEQVIELDGTLPEELSDVSHGLGDPGWLADFVVSSLFIPLEDCQRLLEIGEIGERLRYAITLLNHQLNMLELREEIDGKIRRDIADSQRDMYLREQMRVIQGELGEGDIFQEEMDELQLQIDECGLSAEAYQKATKEWQRLQLIPPMAPEVGIIRTYLDWLVAIPWDNTSDDNLDVKRAKKILDNDHYGLPKVKDRILEHIAVRKMAADKMKSPILCFVGPPGVGKTSMGESIARALGREFVRVSLGGVRDEAEIRGHRRTYIGALPGRIIQTMRKAGTVNPVFMLDEIDKMGMDFHGDPEAALLEALDPEQNNAYSDHYLDVAYDLSKVLFITTANDLYPLAPALLDRLEVIEFPLYSEEDKLEIARRFLIPSQLEAHAMEERGISFQVDALTSIIRQYTYEAGVRNLNREIGTVCRKITRMVAEGKKHPKRVTNKRIEAMLGPPHYMGMRANNVDSVGIATGLAWTSNGGDILTIEVSILPGKGSLMLTGQLGDVMQESAQAALSYMRSRAKHFDVPYDDFENYDVHIHIPEGAIPKEGPSAGITLAIAVISAFTERKIRSDYAMTGEITLRGKVLPVGGVKEKVMSALRAHIKNVILCEHNRKDLIDIPAKTLHRMNIVFVEDMQQVIDTVLLEAPNGGRKRDQDNRDKPGINDDNDGNQLEMDG